MKYTPLTKAVRDLLDDPAIVVSDRIASLAQTAVELLAGAEKLNSLIQQELATDTGGKIEAETKAAGDLEVQLALAETDAEKKRLTPALKKARESVQDAIDAHAQSQIRLKAFRERLAPIELEIETSKADFKEAALQHGGQVAALVAEELRAAVLGLQPLWQLAAALATGAQARGVWNTLQDLHIGDPVNSTPILAGTRYADQSRPVPLSGTSLMFPTIIDLTDGWSEDPALCSIREAAAAPLRVLQKVEAFRPMAQLEAEQARELAYANRDCTPTSGPRTKRPEKNELAAPADAAAKPRTYEPGASNPRTRPGGRMVNGELVYGSGRAASTAAD